MAKVTRKEITTTNAWVNSSLAIDPSTGAVSTAYPLDEVEVDASVLERSKYERPNTHMVVDYDQLDVIAPVEEGECITKVLLDELKEQLSSDDPYKKYMDRLIKAKEKFNA